MKEKIILAFSLVCLCMFGLRSVLPELSSSALVGLFTLSGLIGYFYHVKQSRNIQKFGKLAMSNGWLSLAEIKQILYCQKDNGYKFGEIAVRRNYLTSRQVASILEIQQSMA